jgi:hypothetical protein
MQDDNIAPFTINVAPEVLSEGLSGVRCADNLGRRGEREEEIFPDPHVSVRCGGVAQQCGQRN